MRLGHSKSIVCATPPPNECPMDACPIDADRRVRKSAPFGDHSRHLAQFTRDREDAIARSIESPESLALGQRPSYARAKDQYVELPKAKRCSTAIRRAASARRRGAAALCR